MTDVRQYLEKKLAEARIASRVDGSKRQPRRLHETARRDERWQLHVSVEHA